jgi:stage II sporulation protein D
MQRKITYLIFTLSLFFTYTLHAASFDVRIFTDKKVKSVFITSLIGKYIVSSDDNKITELDKNMSLTLTLDKGKIHIKSDKEDFGYFTSLDIEGDGLKNIIKIKPLGVEANERIYDDDLEFTIERNLLKIINKVEIEHYVAGVVQSEILGASDSLEFFKIQAIITRTYAINNMMKHYKDGYNLCDDVHCQAYKSRCNKFQILMAVSLTAGDVIVDKDKRMISASFHSNSGGETINSEELWGISTSYLKSVKDTFSNGMRNSSWEYKMSVKDWLSYLSDNYKLNTDDTNKVKAVLNFEQNNRKKFLTDSILLKSIRKDLALKSTFFSVKRQGDMVVLKGKGYGHGVGLSQEGAVKMVRYGYTSKQIIQFYYKDVELINYEEIKKIE